MGSLLSTGPRLWLTASVGAEPSRPYLTTSLRNRTVKKWLAMLPALNSSRPSGPRRCAVAREISLYSTTRYRPSTRHTTPTGSVGFVFSTTCRRDGDRRGGA